MNKDDRILAYLERVEETIAKFGHMVQGVFPTEDDPEALGFSYSVGLHDSGSPELLVFSLPAPIGQRLINAIADLMKQEREAGRELQPGHHSLEDWSAPFYLTPITQEAASDYTTFALRRSEGAAKLWQVVWPDRHGNWPWDPAASEEFLRAQPFLGTPPLH